MFLLVLFSMGCGACKSTSKHGDAKFIEATNFKGHTFELVVFPP